MTAFTTPSTVIMNETAQCTPAPVVRQLVSATLRTNIIIGIRSDLSHMHYSGKLLAWRAMHMDLVADTAPASTMRFEPQPALCAFYGATTGHDGMSDTTNKATAMVVRP